MADKKEPNNEKEDELWAVAMQDVKRMPGKAAPRGGKKASVRIRETIAAPERPGNPKKVAAKTGKGIDARTNEKLRLGKFDIEGRVDLHGYRREEAQEKLTKALLKYHRQGKRCVLVITGKGERRTRTDDAGWWDDKPGLLKEMVPQWLGQEPLGDIVIQTHSAAPKDGGAGALYVLLRRKRQN